MLIRRACRQPVPVVIPFCLALMLRMNWRGQFPGVAMMGARTCAPAMEIIAIRHAAIFQRWLVGLRHRQRSANAGGDNFLLSSSGRGLG